MIQSQLDNPFVQALRSCSLLLLGGKLRVLFLPALHSPRGLVPNAETGNERGVAGHVLLVQVVQEPAALVHESHEAAAGGEILGVDLRGGVSVRVTYTGGVASCIGGSLHASRFRVSLHVYGGRFAS